MRVRFQIDQILFRLIDFQFFSLGLLLSHTTLACNNRTFFRGIITCPQGYFRYVGRIISVKNSQFLSDLYHIILFTTDDLYNTKISTSDLRWTIEPRDSVSKYFLDDTAVLIILTLFTFERFNV